MRHFFIGCCLVLFIILIACSSKKEIAGGRESSPNLTGTWELREAQNGMMPTAQHAAGNGNQWRFTETAFAYYNNGDRARSGTYSLVPDATASETVGLELPSGQFNHRIVFNGDTTEKTFVDVRGDTMIMVTGFFPVDAGSRQVFVRVDKPQ